MPSAAPRVNEPARPPPRATAGTPFDGLYFLGAGRTLQLDSGHFTLSNPGDTGPRVLEGDVTERSGRLSFEGVDVAGPCAYQLHDGHLFLGVMRHDDEGRYSDTCDDRFLARKRDYLGRPSPKVTWDEPKGVWTFSQGPLTVIASRTFTDGERVAPEFDRADLSALTERRDFTRRDEVLLTPWSSDLGPVGLLPLREVNGVGTWRSEKGTALVVTAEPAPPPKDMFGNDVDLTRVHWAPGRDGISRESFRVFHGQNHFDSNIETLWVPLGPDEAVRFMSGGCNGGFPSLEYFHRIKA